MNFNSKTLWDNQSVKISVIVLLFYNFFPSDVFGQNKVTMRGFTADFTSNVKLANATVCVLDAKDSTLVKFTYTTVTGFFSLSNIPNGDYILLVSNSGYADFSQKFKIDNDHSMHDFGEIKMMLKSYILNEVHIKAKIAGLKMNGDTIEANAKAYIVQPNDRVEDLLSQIPGLQIDNYGNIKAYGQTVRQIFLDGEEFFSDDPKLITKNIRADMVDKIQIFDKVSNQEKFTGINSGIKEKVINIKLKEDKKDGAFGKVSAGYGTHEYYEGQAIFNRFKPTAKYSAYASGANDGKTGLSNLDNNKIGGSVNEQIGANSLINTSIGDKVFASYNGSYNGLGNPSSRNSGLHYDSKWNKNKVFINVNFQIGSIDVKINSKNQSQQNLPALSLNNYSNQTTNNYAFRQKVDSKLRIVLDTTANVEISTVGIMRKFNTSDDYVSSSEREDQTLLYQQNKRITNKGTGNLFYLSAFFTKKFKKRRRTFSWDISEKYDRAESDGFLNSKVDFYNLSGINDSTESINQRKVLLIKNSAFTSNMAFTEPISAHFSLVFNYGLSINKSKSNRQSYDQSVFGRYDLLDRNYSNDFNFDQLANLIGSTISYSKNKFFLNFGTKVNAVSFKQFDNYTEILYKRCFYNWEPMMNFRYNFSSQKSIYIYYFGYNSQPMINQIQPVRSNTDPLNIYAGNKDLKPSFTNKFNAIYRWNNLLENYFIELQGNLAVIRNDITMNIMTDPGTGKTNTQYINNLGNNAHNYTLFANISKIIDPLDLTFDVDLTARSDISNNYINNVLNRYQGSFFSGKLSLRKNKKDKYKLSASAGPNYNIYTLSLQPAGSYNARGFEVSSMIGVYLPMKFQITANLTNKYIAGTELFSSQNRTIINADFSKTFLSNNSLKASLSGNDLLNQNNLFARNISGNIVSQNSTSSIKRFFMLSLSWDFNRFATINNKK